METLKAVEVMERLIVAALDMQEAEGLTDKQRDKAAQIYDLVNSLEVDMLDGDA